MTRLAYSLLESPDFAQVGNDKYHWDTPGALTFGVHNGEFLHGTGADRAAYTDILGNAGGMTHYKLLAMVKGDQIPISLKSVDAGLKQCIKTLLTGVMSKEDIELLNHADRASIIDGLSSAMRGNGADEHYVKQLLKRDDFPLDLEGAMALAARHPDIMKYASGLLLAIDDYFNEIAALGDWDLKGRAWAEGGKLLVSFWGTPDTDEMAAVSRMVGGILRAPSGSEVWVQTEAMDDEQWIQLGGHGTTPSIDPAIMNKIKSLSALLHTATPERKEQIRAEIRDLRQRAGAEEDEGWGSKKAAGIAAAAGYDAPVRFNQARRQESISVRWLTERIRDVILGP